MLSESTAPADNVQVTIRVLGQQVGQPLAIPIPMMEGDVCKVAELTWPERELIPLDIVQCSDHVTEGGPPYND